MSKTSGDWLSDKHCFKLFILLLINILINHWDKIKRRRAYESTQHIIYVTYHISYTTTYMTHKHKIGTDYEWDWDASNEWEEREDERREQKEE